MADYYTFGVVPADIGRYLPRVAFDTTSQPTLTDAQAIINDHAADLCAFLTGMGLSVQGVNAQPTTAMYRQCQRYILMRFAAQVMRARQQNSQTMADRLDEEADALMKRLREIPPDLGTGRPAHCLVEDLCQLAGVEVREVAIELGGHRQPQDPIPEQGETFIGLDPVLGP